MIFTEYVGSRIRFFRKRRGWTITQLAEKIHKSKSTLSKYESGQIPLDIQTLYEIAQVLKVDVSVLTEQYGPNESIEISPGNPFSGTPQIYMYYYDGRSGRIVTSLLRFREGDGEAEMMTALYMDIADPKDDISCKYLYTGKMYSYDISSCFVLQNRVNPVEWITLIVLHSLGSKVETWGVFTGLSSRPFGPTAFKVLLSPLPPAEIRLEVENLLLSKEELKKIRKYNMLLLDEHI